MQPVLIRCANPKCPVKPSFEHGDIFSAGGEARAQREAANIWNTRPAGCRKSVWIFSTASGDCTGAKSL
jgi:hypothetical protein